MNLGDFRVGQVAAYHNERRGDIVKVKCAQVRYVLAAAEHAERTLKIDPREKDKRYFRTLYHITEPEARENIIKTEGSQIPDRHSSASEENTAYGKVRAGPQRKTYVTVCQLYHSFSEDDTVYEQIARMVYDRYRWRYVCF